MARVSSSLPRLEEASGGVISGSKLMFDGNTSNKNSSKLPKTSVKQNIGGKKLSMLDKIEFLGSCDINKNSGQGQNLFISPTEKRTKPNQGMGLDYPSWFSCFGLSSYEK